MQYIREGPTIYPPHVLICFVPLKCTTKIFRWTHANNKQVWTQTRMWHTTSHHQRVVTQWWANWLVGMTDSTETYWCYKYEWSTRESTQELIGWFSPVNQLTWTQTTTINWLNSVRNWKKKILAGWHYRPLITTFGGSQVAGHIPQSHDG